MSKQQQPKRWQLLISILDAMPIYLAWLLEWLCLLAAVVSVSLSLYRLVAGEAIASIVAALIAASAVAIALLSAQYGSESSEKAGGG